MDRDPNSPTFGCFDRNYWHYKTIDFSSAILQQSVISLYYLPHIGSKYKDLASNWLSVAINFWGTLPLHQNGLNEYYPFESSYPATAFSLQAISKILMLTSQKISQPVKDQIQKTSRYLLDNFEHKALNQQSAGIAALAQLSKMSINIDKYKYQSIISKFFNSQTIEGWFPEYDGPDLGYLSVTIDMLADYYQVTHDPKAIKAADKAINFLSYFVRPSGEINTIINSRETEYLTPYGLAYFSKTNPKASRIYTAVFNKITSNHFLYSVDDRYHLHYIGNSIAKAINVKPKLSKSYQIKPLKTYLIKAKSYVDINEQNTFVISGLKGGSYQITGKDHTVDYGIRCLQNKQIYVSNCFTPDYHVNYRKDYLTISGYLLPAKFFTSNPINSILLRLASFILGQKIISYLKSQLIFHKPNQEIFFSRQFNLAKKQLTTTIKGKNNFKLCTAPKASIRHVASAFSYSQNDLNQPKNIGLFKKYNYLSDLV